MVEEEGAWKVLQFCGKAMCAMVRVWFVSGERRVVGQGMEVVKIGAMVIWRSVAPRIDEEGE